MKWLEKFISSLERALKQSPYLLFVFVSTVFVAISLIFGFRLKQTWAFFLYAVAGTIWRYVEHDIEHRLKKDFKDIGYYRILRLAITTIYQVGNLMLLAALLYYLRST